MKTAQRFRILLIGILLGGCSTHHVSPNPPSPPPNKDFALTATFTYDFTNFAACSSTVVTGCISGFTWGYLRGTAQVPLKTSPASICSGATQPETCTDAANSQLPVGAVTFYVVANFIDNTGAAGQSAQNTTASPMVITAGLPAGLVVAAK